MTRYASTTGVSVAHSKAEIERLLVRYGAQSFVYGHDQERAVVQFEAHGRHVRFRLPLPRRDSREFTRTPTGIYRTDIQAEAAYEQGVRQRWRALCLVVKAKLESVASGIVTFEDEFASFIILPNGETLGEWVLPQIAAAYETGQMPPMLPALGAGA